LGATITTITNNNAIRGMPLRNPSSDNSSSSTKGVVMDIPGCVYDVSG
jgi:hypothetical protein